VDHRGKAITSQRRRAHVNALHLRCVTSEFLFATFGVGLGHPYALLNSPNLPFQQINAKRTDQPQFESIRETSQLPPAILVHALPIRIKASEVRFVVCELQRCVINGEGVSIRELAGFESVRGGPQDQPVPPALRDRGEWQMSSVADVIEKARHGVDRIAVLKQAL
jgi:hypothetical protein